MLAGRQYWLEIRDESWLALYLKFYLKTADLKVCQSIVLHFPANFIYY
jgi:hypothetical protein